MFFVASGSVQLSCERRESMIQKVSISLIRFYQKYLSPLTVSSCRFTPSCSSYALQAIAVHGFLKGLALTVIRIFKCHPFHPGGYDPVPKI